MKVKDALKWGSVFLRNNGFSVSAADEEARLFGPGFCTRSLDFIIGTGKK